MTEMLMVAKGGVCKACEEAVVTVLTCSQRLCQYLKQAQLCSRYAASLLLCVSPLHNL